MERLTGWRLAGIGLGLIALAASTGCHNTRSEVPPPRTYMGGAPMGSATQPQVEFSSTPTSAANNPYGAATGYAGTNPSQGGYGAAAASYTGAPGTGGMSAGYTPGAGNYSDPSGGYGSAADPGSAYGTSAGMGGTAAGTGLPAPDPLQDSYGTASGADTSGLVNPAGTTGGSPY